MQLKHRLSAMLQLHLHSPLNTWFQSIGWRQLEDETRNIKVLWFGASYIKGLMLLIMRFSQYHIAIAMRCIID